MAMTGLSHSTSRSLHNQELGQEGQSTHYFIYRDGKQGKWWNKVSQPVSIPVFLRGFSSALCFAGRLALTWAVPNELSACQRLGEPALNEYVSSHEFVKTKARFPLCWVLHVSEKSCPLLRLNITTSGRKEARIFPIMKGGERHRGSSQPLDATPHLWGLKLCCIHKINPPSPPVPTAAENNSPDTSAGCQ